MLKINPDKPPINAGAKMHRLARAKIHQRGFFAGIGFWVGFSAAVSELHGEGVTCSD